MEDPYSSDSDDVDESLTVPKPFANDDVRLVLFDILLSSLTKDTAEGSIG